MDTTLSAVSSAATKINELHAKAQGHIDRAKTECFSAVYHAVECGNALIAERDKHGGSWLLWLEINCPAICERTAQNYMRAARKAATLADAEPDFQTLKSLYVACGIMPEPLAIEHSSTPPVAGWLRWTPKLDALVPSLSIKEKVDLKRWCVSMLERL